MSDALSPGRFEIASRYRYYAKAIHWIYPIPTCTIRTLAVDRFWRLYYHPAYVNALPLETLTGLLIHELWHLLNNHPQRFGDDLDCKIVNLACDAEINDDLLEAGIKLPDGVITPEMLGMERHKFAEQYFEELRTRLFFTLSQSHLLSSGDQAQDGLVGDPAQGKSGRSEQRGRGKRPSGHSISEGGHGQDSPRPGAGDCGSCAGGPRRPWELPDPKPGEPGIRPFEAELIRRQVAQEIREHAAKHPGSVPAAFARWAAKVLRPRHDWRKELRAQVTRGLATAMGASDYTYTRPNRRRTGDVILPSLRKPIPSVAVVVDTSGSVSDTMLSQALAEVGGVLKAAGQREGVTVLAVDYAVQSCRRVFRPEQVELIGGGGTDMGKGLAATEKLRPRPQVIVVLTDGLTPWPDEPPRSRTRVVIGILGETPRGYEPPPWAHIVEIHEGEDQ